MSFRDNMQHLRATRNMTQEQLAMLLGVSRQSVSKWEVLIAPFLLHRSTLHCYSVPWQTAT